MRILFISSDPFCPECYSGQNRTMLELCQKLVELGHEPILLTGRSHTSENKEILVDSTFGFRLFRANNPLKSIMPLCTSLRPDIVVVLDGHQEKVIEECRSVDIPLAIWFFQLESNYYNNVCPDNDLLYLVSSSFLANRIFNLYGITAQIVAPYIEQKNYLKERNGNRVLFVNPVREKGVEIAFQIAGQRRDQAFNIVESWGVSEIWKSLCFERALDCGNIEWFSSVPDMNFILDQTRLLLVPRFSEEGFCRLITEAQLGGIPVLATNRGYLPDNVGPGGKVLGVDDDLRGWLDEFDRFFEDQSYYQIMSERSRKHALRDELNGDILIEKLLDLLMSHISKYRLNRYAARR